MATVKQLDKRSGITYVYESVSYWDKEKKQPRSKRTLIGRLDTATGTIVPTDGRGKRRTQKEPDPVIRKGPVPTVKTERLFFGATYLLDQIGEETGVTAELKTCFPNHYKQILSIAYYLVLEDQNPLFRFKKWAAIHKHPYGKDIPSQRSTELFQSITEEAKMQFFRLQEKRRYRVKASKSRNRFTGTCRLPRYWLQVRVLMHSYVIREFRIEELDKILGEIC